MGKPWSWRLLRQSLCRILNNLRHTQTEKMKKKSKNLEQTAGNRQHHVCNNHSYPSFGQKRQKETDRQTEKQSEGETGRQRLRSRGRERQRNRERERQTDKQMERERLTVASQVSSPLHLDYDSVSFFSSPLSTSK